MKNLMKKLGAVVIMLAMVLTMSLTSYADPDGIIGNSDDVSPLTVKGLTSTDATVHADQIIEAKYNSDGSFKGYYWKYAPSDSIAAGTRLTNDLLKSDTNLLAYLNYILKNNTLTGATAFSKNASGDYVSAAVPIGTYLVQITGSDTDTYNPVVVSSYYTVNGDKTENEITGGEVAIQTDPAWVKESDLPVFNKEVTKINGTDTDLHTAKVGDVVDFSITVDKIPNYLGNNPVFNVTDTLETGKFAYVNDSIKVYVDGTLLAASNYTLTPAAPSNTFNINFVTATSGYTLNSYYGKPLEIKYQATLLTTADENSNSNDNTAQLEYTKDSKLNISSELQDITKTYTFEIKNIIKKVKDDDANGSSEILNGAEFTIYTKDPAAADFDSSTDVYKNGIITDGKVVSGSNGSDGYINIAGLAAGTYYLVETKAPTGYTLNTHVYTIVVSYTEKACDDTNSTVTANKGIGGKELDTWKVTIDGTDVEGTGITNGKVDIPNTKLNTLPSTGGMGTYLFTIIGVAVMATMAFFFFKGRKAEEE